MKWIMIVTVILLASCTHTEADAKRPSTGNNHCSKWNSAANSSEKTIYQIWVSGYVQGISHANAGGVRKGIIDDSSITDEMIFLWYDRKCAEEPNQMLNAVGMKLIASLSGEQKKGEQKKTPERGRSTQPIGADLALVAQARKVAMKESIPSISWKDGSVPVTQHLWLSLVTNNFGEPKFCRLDAYATGSSLGGRPARNRGIIIMVFPGVNNPMLWVPGVFGNEARVHLGGVDKFFKITQRNDDVLQRVVEGDFWDALSKSPTAQVSYGDFDLYYNIEDLTRGIASAMYMCGTQSHGKGPVFAVQ